VKLKNIYADVMTKDVKLKYLFNINIIINTNNIVIIISINYNMSHD
jgi:hypothetical protein